jgi:hypothetical protein
MLVADSAGSQVVAPARRSGRHLDIHIDDAIRDKIAACG